MALSLITIILLSIVVIEVSYLLYKSGFSFRMPSSDKVLLDTSALMDGRIVTAAQTGFIPSELMVPRSVINELQLLADQADPEKRSRARRGLDAIQELQAMPHIQVTSFDDGKLGSGGVDERLIDLARKKGAAVCTIDFNLNKAATAMGVRVLNINELAGSIRMAFLPGETISLTLTQKGQSNSQAVGYLADGTMVVVDKASSKIGQTIEVEFVRSLQTAAGRMMFAKPTEKQNEKGVAEQKPKTVVISEAKKSTGRRPAVKSKGSRAAEMSSNPNESSQQIVSKSSSRRRSDKRKTNEDSLIDLVNQQ
ncbi:MAG: TRAM domain-containing protein [Candidatus Saccharimonadales bacterium]